VPASHRSCDDAMTASAAGRVATSAGARFRAALAAERPLQIPGAICAYHALLAQRTGFKAIYLSGGGVAAGSLGLPDLGISNLDDVLTDVRRITDACPLPLLVDADTGFGASAFNIARTVRSLIKFGAAAMHIEDQVGAKRCGHRPGKELVSRQEMVDRIRAAVERARACVEAGADMIFPEAITGLSMYRQFADAVKAPILANLTEFGQTPLFTVDEIAGAGVAMALYPLSAFRAMNQAALNVYETLRRDGTQKRVVATMQTRDDLYDYLGYHAYEEKLDRLFARRKDA
jgi:methylisocitrate lyase